MKARITEVRQIVQGTVEFGVELSEPMQFQAGQTCDVTLVSPKYHDEHGTARTFSIASSPADSPRLLFATRVSQSAFKRSLVEAQVGAEVDVDGPYGSFTLHRNATRPAALFAGGIGITPFRSIIKDATERRLPHALTLVYSNRTRQSTAFLDDFERWQAQNPNFRLIATITDTPYEEGWPHATGFVDTQFMALHVPALASTIAYIAGPPAFVTAVRGALESGGADPDNIRTEEFSGY
jgi:ferredoxin-NADP reductase